MSHKKRMILRDEMKRVVASLDQRWIQAASRELCGRLSDLIDKDLNKPIEHILAWVPHFPGEVDLSSFINEQLDRRIVYIPRVLPDRSMTFISIGKDWITNVGEGFGGIPEPEDDSGAVYDPVHAIRTAVIMPGLAMDNSGNRLGRGAGYYDRFLGRSSMIYATKIGVCWSLQIVKSVPAQSHDVILDWICHERGCMKSGVTFEEDVDE